MSKSKTLYSTLKYIGACKEGRYWYLSQKRAGKSDRTIWLTCPYGQYMVYIIAHLYTRNIIKTDPYRFTDIKDHIYLVSDFVKYMSSTEERTIARELANIVRKRYRWLIVKKAMNKLKNSMLERAANQWVR
jgi:hypothetical protein